MLSLLLSLVRRAGFGGGQLLLALLLLGSRPALAQTVPANDECAQAVPLSVAATCTVPMSGTVAGATQSLPPGPGCGGSGPAVANDVWYSFVANGSSEYITLAPLFPAALNVRLGTCANSGSLFCANIGVGNTNPTLVPGLTAGQTYYFRIYANNGLVPPAGIGSTFALCVSPGPTPPINDECAGATPIAVTTNCPMAINGTVAEATQSLPPTANCGSSGPQVANDVWYSFVATGSTQFVSVFGLFQVALDVRSGTCTNSASIYCSTSPNGQFLVSGLTTGQTYFIRLYAIGSMTSSGTSFIICVNPGPMSVANDECAGAVPLSVTASCATPSVRGNYSNATQSLPSTANCGSGSVARDLWYSFVASGTAQRVFVSGVYGAVVDVRTGTCASSTSVYCTTATASQPGVINGLTSGQTYFLRLYPNTNAVPAPTNGDFTLCLTPGPLPPANDECAGAIVVAVVQDCTNSTNGTVELASQSLPATMGCPPGGQSQVSDVWFRFVASASAQLITLNSRFSATLDVRSGSCANSTSVYCNSQFTSSPGSVTVGGLTAGQTYFIRIYTNGTFMPTGSSATFDLCVSLVPTPLANDECAGAISVPVTANCTAQVSGTVAGATASLPLVATCNAFGQYQASDVWYSFVSNGPTNLITLTNNFPATLNVRSGTCANSTSISCTTVPAGRNTSTLVSGLTAGQTYFIRIYSDTFIQPAGFAAECSLCVTTPTLANDEPCGAVMLPLTGSGGPLQPVAGTTVGATTSLQPGVGISAACAANAAPQDVWFTLTPAPGVTRVALTFTGSAAGLVRVYTAPNCAAGPFVQVLCQGSGTPSQGLGNVSLPNITPGQRYYVVVSGYDPADPAGTFTIGATTILAARGVTSAAALLVYPNPSGTGQLAVRLPGGAAGTGTLLNALGQAVRSFEVASGEQVISTAGLAAGVYVLRVVVGGAVLTRRVVLE